MKVMMHVQNWGSLFAALVLLISSASAQTYTVTDLGVLPGYTSSWAGDLNTSGQVVGCSDTSSGDNEPCGGMFGTTGHASLWNASTGLQDLGTLGGGTYSVADGINDNGQVVGWSLSTNAEHAFFWTKNTGMIDLGTLTGGTLSQAFVINRNGVICGQSDSGTSNGVNDLVIWTPTHNIFDLGSLPGAVFNLPAFISDQNRINGTSIFVNLGNFTYNAFIWTQSGGLKALPTLSGATLSQGAGGNSAGIIVGSSNSASNSNEVPIYWDNKFKIHRLPVLPETLGGVAVSINDHDQVVGYSTGAITHAVLWTENAGVQDLNQLIGNNNSQWTLLMAGAINNAGQIIGYGVINGENHAFLLTPQKN